MPLLAWIVLFTLLGGALSALAASAAAAAANDVSGVDTSGFAAAGGAARPATVSPSCALTPPVSRPLFSPSAMSGCVVMRSTAEGIGEELLVRGAGRVEDDGDSVARFLLVVRREREEGSLHACGGMNIQLLTGGGRGDSNCEHKRRNEESHGADYRRPRRPVELSDPVADAG